MPRTRGGAVTTDAPDEAVSNFSVMQTEEHETEPMTGGADEGGGETKSPELPKVTPTSGPASGPAVEHLNLAAQTTAGETGASAEPGGECSSASNANGEVSEEHAQEPNGNCAYNSDEMDTNVDENNNSSNEDQIAEGVLNFLEAASPGVRGEISNEVQHIV